MNLGLNLDNVSFPDRKSITKSDTHIQNIITEVKKVDVDKINFDKEDFNATSRVIQKQRVYIWIRLYLKNEIKIAPETLVQIEYNGQEKLDTHFMFFGKKGLERDKDGEIVNFDPEDDTKVLCLMVDVEKIDKDNEDIPFMKTLFKLGKFYQPQIIKKSDFNFKVGETNLDFYDIDF